jgi:hypothetical protein
LVLQTTMFQQPIRAALSGDETIEWSNQMLHLVVED